MPCSLCSTFFNIQKNSNSEQHFDCFIESTFRLGCSRNVDSIKQSKCCSELLFFCILLKYWVVLVNILQRLHEMRDNKEFQQILDEAKSISGIEEANTDGAQKRKVPRWMESGDSMLTETLHTTWTVHSGSIGDMRQSYFEAIDVIVESINRRFEQEDLTLIKTIEQILLRSMIERGYPIDTLEHALINKDKLRVQLDDLPTILGMHNVDRKKKITSISRVSTIAEIFNSMPIATE